MRMSVVSITSSTCSCPIERKNRPALIEAGAKDPVHHELVAPPQLDVRRVLVAQVEVDIAAAQGGFAPARVPVRIVVAHPAIEDRHLLARGDGARALDAAFTARVEGRVGIAAVVAEPAPGDRRVGDDHLITRKEGELGLRRGHRRRVSHVDPALPGCVGDDDVTRAEGLAREDPAPGDLAVAEDDRRQAEHRLDTSPAHPARPMSTPPPRSRTEGPSS